MNKIIEKKDEEVQKELDKNTLEAKQQDKLDKKIIKKEKYIAKAPKREKRQERKEYYSQKNEPPVRPILEEIGNSVTHGLGAIFAIIALVLLILKSDTGYKLAGALVYGISMFIMMLMSCLYHAWRKGSRVKKIWRRFDYSSIYLLIGGTFAPLLLVNWYSIYNNYIGIILFIIQWVLIVTGITIVCVFGPGRYKWVHFTLYFTIGWSGLVFIPGWIQSNRSLLWMILAGGLVYTLGMVPFAKKSIKGAHFIWHFFVLAGAIVHFIGIYNLVY